MGYRFEATGDVISSEESMKQLEYVNDAFGRIEDFLEEAAVGLNGEEDVKQLMNDLLKYHVDKFIIVTKLNITVKKNEGYANVILELMYKEHLGHISRRSYSFVI